MSRKKRPAGASLTRPLGNALRKVSHMTLPRISRTRLGASPGIAPEELSQFPGDGSKAIITCVDYSPEQIHSQNIQDLDAFLATQRPSWVKVRWINVDGLGDTRTIQGLASKYNLHPLAVEDVLHVHQRPKVDLYDGLDNHHSRVFIIARMAQLIEGKLRSEQVSLFLGHSTVITFQETQGDVWDPIRERLNKPGTRVRLNDASFLVYCFIDAITDQFFPILEHYGDLLEDLEDEVLTRPEPQVINNIHAIKRQLLMIRRDIWPMREMVQVLSREPHECMADNTRTYLRDVYDHAVQIIDLLETYREVASGMVEIYMSAISQRMNEVMKVLTIMGTIFIPLTFLAGVYGMNFTDIPEMKWKYAYPTFWGICLVIAGGMLVWFRRRRWL